MKRSAQAMWNGGLRNGNGTISAESGALKSLPFSFGTRFENAVGTNPEELIASALAGCFSMALSGGLVKAGYNSEKIHSDVTVSIEQMQGGWTITAVHIECKATVHKIDAKQFESIAQETKENCPVSRALNVQITLNAVLV